MADTHLLKRQFDRETVHVHTGTATIHQASFTWTNYNPLVTITPDSNHALYDLVVAIDLDLATTGFATVYTTQTLVTTLGRKIDGTNWRYSNNLATSSIAASAASTLSLELTTPEVGPNELISMAAKLSAVLGTDTTFNYVVYYRAGAPATVLGAS